MAPSDLRILTVNGGSSSIKFALFEDDPGLGRILTGSVDRIGSTGSALRVKGADRADCILRPVLAPDHRAAVDALMSWIMERGGRDALAAVGHRVVHGGAKYWEPQRITTGLTQDLRTLSPFDPEHLPEEILLAETFHARFPDLPQVACFDTAFHHDMPRVARILPIPRCYEAGGVRRYGFHGISYESILGTLAREGAAIATRGRLVVAHLGSGASLCAVRDGRSMDTSMGFTPTGGVPMGTRSGDLDPGLAWYLSRTEGLDAKRWNDMVNFRSGLLGVSETSADMRDLLGREAQDIRAAEAVELFCYQIRKWIGSFAAALGGLDALVFSGGVGENAPLVRERICRDLGFLGIELDHGRNAANADMVSNASGRVAVRIVRTDEESQIALSVRRVLSDGK
jgi:acetate kinase